MGLMTWVEDNYSFPVTPIGDVQFIPDTWRLSDRVGLTPFKEFHYRSG